MSFPASRCIIPKESTHFASHLPLPATTLLERTKMELTPREKGKLLIFTAVLLAERRRARGLKLNYTEAIALMSTARSILTHADVMEGIPEMTPDIQVEATFLDDTKLVTMHQFGVIVKLTQTNQVRQCSVSEIMP